jgi:hypothetical protein
MPYMHAQCVFNFKPPFDFLHHQQEKLKTPCKTQSGGKAPPLDKANENPR